MVNVLLLLKFLRYEGKSGLVILLVGKPLTSLRSDKSEFEVMLLGSLKKQLKKAALSTDTLLIVSYVCNSFDNFDDVIGQVGY